MHFISESTSPSFTECFSGDPPDQSMLEQQGTIRFDLEDQIVQAIIEA